MRREVDRFATVRAIPVFRSQLLPTIAAIPLGVPLGHLCRTSLLTLFVLYEESCLKQRTLHSLLGMGIVRNFRERRLGEVRRMPLPCTPINKHRSPAHRQERAQDPHPWFSAGCR